MWWKNEMFGIEVLGENGVIASNEVLGQSPGWAAHRLATRPSRRIWTMGAQAVGRVICGDTEVTEKYSDSNDRTTML